MANVITELIYKITGDNSGIKKKIKETESSFKRMAKVVGAAIAGIGFLQITKQLVRLASDAEETASKFGVVFSNISDDANAAAKNLVDNFGLSSTAAKKLLSDTGDLLTGFGFTQETALDLSNQLNTLAVDLASFTNYSGGAAGASAALTKALLGERESIKSLGIAITEADLKSYIEDQGKSYETATRQEKAQATLALAIRQSGNAIGDFARESDSYENVQRRIQARFQDLGAELGQNLLPALSNLGLAFLESSKDGGVLMKLFNQITKVIGNVVNAMAILTARLDQASLEKDFKNAAKEAEKFLDTQRRLRQEIINRYGGMKQIEELSKQESLRGKEALMLLQAYNKAAEDTTRAIRKTQDASDEYKNGLTFMEGIQRRIEGVEGDINQRLNDRVNIATTLKTVTGEAGKETIKTFEDMAQEFNNYTQAVGGGLQNLASAFQAYNSAVYQGKIDRLDAELEAELEAAGVSEETTLEQAQREYDIAQATGSELEKEEKRRALEKAKIEEKYRKKRAMLEYEAAVAGWELQLASAVIGVPLSVMNALVSGWAAAALNPALAGWYPALLAGLAGTAGAVQVAAIQQSKPQPPKFAEGGIVPGTSFTGDRVTAQLNSGEMVLNQSQQARLFNAANGAGGSGNITVYLGDEQIYKSLYNASKRGDLIIDARSVVTR